MKWFNCVFLCKFWQLWCGDVFSDYDIVMPIVTRNVAVVFCGKIIVMVVSCDCSLHILPPETGDVDWCVAVPELVCSPEPGSSQRNDLTGSCWCRAGWPSSACCCSCCSCSALAKLRGWGHRSAPVWMKAGLSASAITTVRRAQAGVTRGREWKPSLEFSEVV